MSHRTWLIVNARRWGWVNEKKSFNFFLALHACTRTLLHSRVRKIFGEKIKLLWTDYIASTCILNYTFASSLRSTLLRNTEGARSSCQVVIPYASTSHPRLFSIRKFGIQYTIQKNLVFQSNTADFQNPNSDFNNWNPSTRWICLIYPTDPGQKPLHSWQYFKIFT